MKASEQFKVTTLSEAFMKMGVEWFEESYPEGLELKSRMSVFNGAMTVWLMMAQKGIAENSLVSAVQQLRQSTSIDKVAQLVLGSKKFVQQLISNNPGGFSHARQRLPLDKVEEFADALSSKVEQSHSTATLHGYHAFILDGSSVHLSNTAEIRESFPPQRNQHMTLQPQARIVVAHNIVTGTAFRPEIGSSHDSEQSLSQSVMKRLPQRALIIGDRNFGVFSVAWSAKEASLKSLVRLQTVRVQSMLGKVIDTDGVFPFVWKPSAKDRTSAPNLPDTASVTGTVIVATVDIPGQRSERMCFFTTAKLTSEQALDIYKKRWFVETDLRSIKQTVHLETINAKTPDVARKEIILGIVAYTLIRTVIASGAKQLELAPRDLSFSRARQFVITIAIRLSKSQNTKELQTTLNAFLPGLRQLKHPTRSKFRSEPRAIVKSARKAFPLLKTPRSQTKKKLISSNS